MMEGNVWTLNQLFSFHQQEAHADFVSACSVIPTLGKAYLVTDSYSLLCSCRLSVNTNNRETQDLMDVCKKHNIMGKGSVYLCKPAVFSIRQAELWLFYPWNLKSCLAHLESA